MKVFVLSTGRTGTTFLASALAKTGIDARHEPGPRWLRNVSNAYVAHRIGDRTARRVIAATRRPLFESVDPYLEASCLIYGLAAPISHVFHDSAIVHLVRDPRTYVKSALQWGVHRLGGRPLNAVPFRRLSPGQISGSVRDFLGWSLSTQFERICWSWTAMNRAMRTAETVTPRVLVRFEDVFAEKGEPVGLRAITDLLGLGNLSSADLAELTSERVNPSRVGSVASWEDWPTAWLEHLVGTCADEASRYGYPIADEVGRVLARRTSSE